jgi:hypothetical protein
MLITKIGAATATGHGEEVIRLRVVIWLSN